MNLMINDEPYQVDAPLSLLALLVALKYDPTGSALAVNQVIIPRHNWSTHPLVEGDNILLFQAIAGG